MVNMSILAGSHAYYAFGILLLAVGAVKSCIRIADDFILRQAQDERGSWWSETGKVRADF
jgi:hypothetical protein